ncbi:MAG: NgoMIV family type II restriction endonuclease [bacterium]
MNFEQLRKEYHQELSKSILRIDSNGIPTNCDKHSDISVFLARTIIDIIGKSDDVSRSSGQTSGKVFETKTKDYLQKAFTLLLHLRPGKWLFEIGKRIEEFEQYSHLSLLSEALEKNNELRAALGDYLIHPDIIIGRKPIEDTEINCQKRIISKKARIASFSPIRIENSTNPILHASISCKWTIRSDRSQNARTEGLNLIRNRKGHTPHIVIITAEPYPQRIASLALGTGDIDCVYHFALHELNDAAALLKNEAVIETLDLMVKGKRLRDISDLPFDLVI